MNAPPGKLVDHIDGDKLNNRRSNLRLCDTAGNTQNRKMHKNNSTGYKGVSCSGDNYTVTVQTDYIGTYTDAEAAARVYDRVSKARFGEFYRPNFPEAPLITDEEIAPYISLPELQVPTGRHSQYRGVKWNARKKRWHVIVTINKKRKHLGYFTDEEAAGIAYAMFKTGVPQAILRSEIA